MPDVVQQRGRRDGAGIFVGDPSAVGKGSQMVEREPGKVEHAERMLVAGVFRARPDARNEAELLNPFEAQERLRADNRRTRGAEAESGRRGVADRRHCRKANAWDPLRLRLN